MHYVALVGDKEFPIEISEVSTDCYQVIIDGQAHIIDARAVSASTLSLIHDNQAYNVETEINPLGHGHNVLVRGHLVSAEVMDLRTLRLRKTLDLSAGPDGPAQIIAPMAGKVVDILVSEGQTVEANQGLLVVEAMKMENELRAPRAGVVKNLKVQKGATVDGGVPLCVIE